MICHILMVQVHFVFCQLNFIVFFSFLLKYYYILYIIIVFRLFTDKLVSCFFYCLSPRDQSWDVTWGRVYDFSFLIFLIFHVILFLLIEVHCTFSFSYIVQTCYIYYYCI